MTQIKAGAIGQPVQIAVQQHPGGNPLPPVLCIRGSDGVERRYPTTWISPTVAQYVTSAGTEFPVRGRYDVWLAHPETGANGPVASVTVV